MIPPPLRYGSWRSTVRPDPASPRWAGPWPIAQLYLAQSGLLGLLAALPALPAALFVGRRYAAFRAE